MKILYKQPSNPTGTSLYGLGICQCYLKHIFPQGSQESISLKTHYHRDYEIHMVEQGSVIYEVEGKLYHLNRGHFLLLPPQKPHRVVERTAQTSTFSITFCLTQNENVLAHIDQCASGQLSDRIWENIRQIETERKNARALSEKLIEGDLLEILVLLWRLCGKREMPAVEMLQEEDPRLTLAKQYIYDNIELALAVEDVSSYCHLSTKQLSRLFLHREKMTPAAYIKEQRTQRMEKLLQEGELSLRDISEKMNCSSEYYFNTFFKRNAGMTPGEYRMMKRPK